MVEESMAVSLTRKNRKSNGKKKALKELLVRHLRLENLERRELMAADIAPFHNYQIPQDVDGDYRISPLDALIVINQLNAAGGGSLQDRTPPSSRTGLFDTDADNTLSPLDALTVINALNSGEGEVIKANVKYQFYLLNADGTTGRNLDPNPNDSVSEAVVNTGEKFVVRTLMADFRNNPFGVFSAYHDLSFTNSDSSTEEKMQLQWSDYNSLKIGMPNLGGGSIAILTGSFKLQYGTERTAAINIATRVPAPGRPPVTDAAGTAVNIQAALEQLPGIGVGNVVVRVNTIDPSLGYNFDVFFRNAKARTNMPAPTIEETNFTVSTGGAPTATISDITNPTPANADASRGALNYVFAGQNPLYVNGPNGTLSEISGTPGGRRMNLMGGFSNSSSTIPQPQAFEYFNIVETAFLGAKAGTINLTGSVSPLPTGATGNNLGIALYNDGGAYLNSSQVSFENAVVRIVDRLSAVNDSFPVSEDIAANLNVGNNDTERDGLAFGIVAVTQPTNGAGTVSFTAGGAAKSVLFTPTADYFGPSTFTYTIRSSRGDEATATVTLDVLPINDPPVVLNRSFSATEDQTSPLAIAPTSIFSPGPANEASQTLSLSIVTAPPAAQGTATINSTTGNLEFIPAADFFGVVNLVVRGTDSGPNTPAPNSNNSTATLTITVAAVNDAPQIVGTTFSVNEDPTAPLTITPAQLFTPGPANESTQTVTLAIVAGPSIAQGTANIVGGSLQFSPAANFFGSVVMTVRGTDNGTPPASTDSTITINVTPVNDPPVANDDVGTADRFIAVGLTGVPTNLDVMRNDNAGPFETTDAIRILPFTNSTTKLGGTVSVNGDGTRVVYTPPTGQVNAVDSFTYKIADNGNLTDEAITEVFIVPPVLPYAVDDSFTVAESTDSDKAHTFDVLGNDLINDGATPRLVSIVTQPAAGKGTASIVGSGNRDDRVQYTAPRNFFGNAVVQYRMTDSEEGSDPSNTFVTIRVTEVNDPPVAVGKVMEGTEDTVKVISGSSITGDLSRGPFEDAQSLTVTGAVVKSGGGTAVLNGGNITYTPAEDYFGPVVIEYTVTDNGTTNGVNDFKSSTANLTLNIAPVNDPPVTSPKSLRAVEDTALIITVDSVIAGDVPGPANEIAPPQSQVVSFVALTGSIATARGGTITQLDEGQLRYNPPADFNGTDTFVYTITDGQPSNSTATGTVTLNVSEVNDNPVARSITRKVFAGVSTVIDMTAELATMSRGAANESSQTLVMSRKVTDPTIGSVTSFGATQFTYFATLGTNGTTSFQYEVVDNGTTDGNADPKTSIATITIEVLPFIPSTLRGTVFIDDDADGIRDRSTNNEPLEVPIGGVEVTLSYPDPVDSRKTITVTEMTEADGSYDFDLLPPGTYTVSYSTPMMMTNSSGSTMSYTRTIAAPGGANIVFDFAVLGIIPEYGSHLEYLASSFYNRDGSLRTKGMYAGVRADGTTDWTSRKDGFSSGVFHELVLSQDGSQAFLTEVRADGKMYTATLNDRRQFIRMRLADGSTLVRVLATSADLTWVQVNPAAPPVSVKGYLETVDDYFEQEGWDWP
jgi:hypothetical protein